MYIVKFTSVDQQIVNVYMHIAMMTPVQVCLEVLQMLHSNRIHQVAKCFPAVPNLFMGLFLLVS